MIEDFIRKFENCGHSYEELDSIMRETTDIEIIEYIFNHTIASNIFFNPTTTKSMLASLYDQSLYYDIITGKWETSYNSIDNPNIPYSVIQDMFRKKISLFATHPKISSDMAEFTVEMDEDVVALEYLAKNPACSERILKSLQFSKYPSVRALCK